MHGLINRSIEAFLRDSYGENIWAEICHSAGIDVAGFLPTHVYPDSLSLGLIDAASERLGKTPADLLEDIGAWLALFEPVRRLLRFSGLDFAGFLLALEELPERIEMIVPGIGLAEISVRPCASGEFVISQPDGRALWLALMTGLVRAMADDYGALVLIESEGCDLRVELLAAAFAEGRDFRLAGDEAAKI